MATLWVITAASALAAASGALAHDAVARTNSRSRAVQGFWSMYGCVERVRHAAHSALWTDAATPSSTSEVWMRLNEYVGRMPSLRTCDVTILPGGVRANVNDLSATQLHALLTALRVPRARADSLVDAILDWRDLDNAPQALGAERDWYANRHRPAPRNGPLAAFEELRFVRGLENPDWLRSFLDVETERVLWTRASRPVLATLPGMTPAALDVFEQRREVVTDLLQIVAFPELPPDARAALAAASAELSSRITRVPETWRVRAHDARSHSTLEARFALADGHLMVLRQTVRP